MSRGKQSINDSWQELLARYDIPAQIARDGSYTISADTINTVREARLMAKFDEKRSVPACLKAHNIQILPISRREYVLGPYETYQELDYPRQHPVPIAIPALDTLQASEIHSEAEALHFLTNSGVWAQIFASERVHQTISGRRVSGQFTYTIRRSDQRQQQLQVDNAQIEIDAGYETPEAVFLCEAKNRHVTELHLRQLYYPFRFVLTQTTKPIFPVAVIYTNQTFYISRYRFADPHDYNSLELDQRYCYTLTNPPVRAADIAAAYAGARPPDEAVYRQIPFPQADNFLLLWRLCEALAQRPHTTADLTAFIGYAQRQSDYYANAGRSLGMIERVIRDGVTHYQLTTHGHRVMQAPPYRQRALLIQAMMGIPCFYELFPMLLQRRRAPDRAAIIAAMERHPFLAQNTPVTIHRRASTVEHWLAWAAQSIDVWDT